MGNRAVVTTKDAAEDSLGLYLHWNGGIESVLAFLAAAKKIGVRNLSGDSSYGYARLSQIIGNFFGGTTSVGVDILERLDRDNYDNGTYYVDQEWNVVDRKFTKDEAKTVEDLDSDQKKRYDEILDYIMSQYKKGEYNEYVLNVA